jgi:hypothetical protein
MLNSLLSLCTQTKNNSRKQQINQKEKNVKKL